MKTPPPADKIFDLPIPIPGHEAVSHLYLVQSAKTALIDTGPGSTLPLLFSRLAELQIDPSEIDYILATHIHLDHLGGLNQALARMPNARVIVHPRGIPHLVKPDKLWEASLATSGQIALEYGEPEAVAFEKLVAAEEGQIIDLGGIRLESIFTPGHAPHHLSFIDRTNRNLFAGEAAGIYFPDTGFIRPAAPPPFDPARSLASLDRLIDLRPLVIYYCHYGQAENGLDNLKIARSDLLLWTQTISGFFEPGLTPDDDFIDQMVDAIITQDGTKDRLQELPAQRVKTELYFLHNNVLGFWDYFERENTRIKE